MAAFPADVMTGRGGNLAAFISEYWSPDILNFAKDKKHLAMFFTNRSSELSGGGDTIHIGTMSEMSANTRTYTASPLTTVVLNAVTDPNVDLIVNTWKEVSFAISDGDAAVFLKSRYTQENYAKNAAYTAAMTLEDDMYKLFGTFTDSVGLSTAVILDSDIRKALGIIEFNTKKEVTDNQFRFFFETKVWWNQIAGITTYQLHINTVGNDPVTHRPMTMLYGCPVSLSNRIPFVTGSAGRYNAIADKDAIHYATVKLPFQTGDIRVQSNYIPEYLATVTTCDHKYGVKLARPTYGVNILTLAS